MLQVRGNLPGGESFVYRARTIKLSYYTRNDIFRKHLLLLLPYYILRYEKDAELYEFDEQKLQELLSDYEEIRKQLETELLGEEKSVLYTDMIDLIIQISDHIFAGRETVRKGVEETMGGKVLKLKSERLREEGWQEGLAEGKEQGLVEGKEEGIEFQKIASVRKLIKNGGMSLEQAMRLLEIPMEEQEIYEEKLNMK